jgi:hypothetical protein
MFHADLNEVGLVTNPTRLGSREIPQPSESRIVLRMRV